MSFQCSDCRGWFDSMLGNICNLCQKSERHHRENLAAMEDAAQAYADSKAKPSPTTEPPTDAGTYAFKHDNSGLIECFSVHKNDGGDPFVITYDGPVWVGHLEGQWSPKLESFFDGGGE